MTYKIDVLDHGYVRLSDVFGSDLTVVNAARVSYAKASQEFSERDARLIRYLAKHDHSSPFRHAFLSFEVKAPLMVARQWYKYVVGSDHVMDSWSEASRRYITMEPEFYVPNIQEWRSAPADSKQGSGDPLNETDGVFLTGMMEKTIEESMMRYRQALDRGVAPEQARCFLPAYSMYTLWRWTASLQSVSHFLKQRLEDNAQVEIQKYAQAVYGLSEPHFPISIASLLGEES